MYPFGSSEPSGVKSLLIPEFVRHGRADTRLPVDQAGAIRGIGILAHDPNSRPGAGRVGDGDQGVSHTARN